MLSLCGFTDPLVVDDLRDLSVPVLVVEADDLVGLSSWRIEEEVPDTCAVRKMIGVRKFESGSP